MEKICILTIRTNYLFLSQFCQGFLEKWLAPSCKFNASSSKVSKAQSSRMQYYHVLQESSAVHGTSSPATGVLCRPWTQWSPSVSAELSKLWYQAFQDLETRQAACASRYSLLLDFHCGQSDQSLPRSFGRFPQTIAQYLHEDFLSLSSSTKPTWAWSFCYHQVLMSLSIRWTMLDEYSVIL